MRLNPQLVENVLANDYTDNNSYHNRHHVENMLEGFGMWEDSYWDFPKPLIRVGEAAILFHDANYKVGDPNNEENASLRAREMLLKCGWPEPYVHAVQDIILTTKPFTKYDPDFNYFKGAFDRYRGNCCFCRFHDLIDIIHDLDWIGFSDEKTALVNSEKIFREASNALRPSTINDIKDEEAYYLTDFKVKKNQIEFYKKLKEQIISDGYLYRSPCFEDIPLDIIIHNVEVLIEKSLSEFGEIYARTKQSLEYQNARCSTQIELPPNPFDK